MGGEGGSGSSSSTESEKETSSQDSESSAGGEGKGASQEQQAAQIDQREAEQQAEQQEQQAEQQQAEQAEEAQGEGGEPNAEEGERGGADKEEEASGDSDAESEGTSDRADEDAADTSSTAGGTATESGSDEHEMATSDDSESAHAVDDAQAEAERQQADAIQAPQEPTKPDAFDDMLQRLPSMDMQAWAKDTEKAVFGAINDLVAEYEQEGGASAQPAGLPDQSAQGTEQDGQPSVEDALPAPAETARGADDKEGRQLEFMEWQKQLDEDQDTLRGLTEGKTSEAIRTATQRRQERLGGALTASVGRTEAGGSIGASGGSRKGSPKGDVVGRSGTEGGSGSEGQSRGGVTWEQKRSQGAGREFQASLPQTEAAGKSDGGPQPRGDARGQPALSPDLRMRGGLGDQGPATGPKAGPPGRAPAGERGPSDEAAAGSAVSQPARPEASRRASGEAAGSAVSQPARPEASRRVSGEAAGFALSQPARPEASRRSPGEAAAERKGKPSERAPGAEHQGQPSEQAAAAGRKDGVPEAGDKSGPVEPRDAASVMRGPTELSRALNDIGKANLAYLKDRVNKGPLPVITAIGQKLLVRDEQGRVMGDVRGYWKGTSDTNVPATNLKPGTYLIDTRTGEVRQFKDGKLQPNPVGKLRPFEARSSREALTSGHVDLFVSAKDPARREAFLKAISSTPEAQQKKEGWQPCRALAVRVPEPKDMMAQDKQQDAKWDAAKHDALGRVNDHIEDSLKGIVKNPEQVLAGAAAGKAGLYAAGSEVAMRLGESKAMALAAQTRDEILVSREICAGGLAHAAILATGEAVGASVRATIGPRLRTDPNVLLRRSAEALGPERAAGESASRMSGSLRGGERPSVPESSPRAGGTGPGGEGGGGRPPRDTVPDYYSDTLPGHGSGGHDTVPDYHSDTLPGRGPGAGRDTVPDYHADTLPGRGTLGERGAGGAGRESASRGLGPQGPGRGDTLRGMGPEPRSPASSLQEQWSSAARESGRAPEAGPSPADRQAPGPGRAPGDAAQSASRRSAADGARQAGSQDRPSQAPGTDVNARLGEYGISARNIQRGLDAAQAQGLTREQALANLQHEARLMDHLRDEFCGGSAERARSEMAGAEGARGAIGDAHWERQLRQWQARNEGALPGPEVLRQFDRAADEYVRNLDHPGGGAPGGRPPPEAGGGEGPQAPGRGPGGPGGTLRGMGPEALEGGAPGRGGTLRGMGPEAPGPGAGDRGGTVRGLGPQASEPGAAARGSTLRGLGPESPPPASPLREHWSTPARESGRAAEGPAGAADRPPPGPRAASGRAEAQPGEHAVPGAPDGTATMPVYTDRQIQFLGANASDQAGRLGMRPQDLDNYVGDLYQRELLQGRDAATARRNAAQTAREQIAQVNALGRDLGRELTQYGYTPDDIAQRVVETQAQGLTRDETLASLKREVQLANHLRDEFCEGAMELARAKLAGVEDARLAVKVEHWAEQVQTWNANHPEESLGREGLAALGDRAEEYVRNLERNLGGRGGRAQ